MKNSEKMLHLKFKKYGSNAKLWMRKCVMLLPEIEKQLIWQKKGFASIYEYAAKLSGMNRATVNDALRILKRTEDMPELRKVVEQKGMNAVRPVIAIATPETDGFWAQKAMIMSKNVLETYVKELYQQEFDSALQTFQPGSLNTPNTIIQQKIFCTGTSENAKNRYKQAIEPEVPSKKIVGMELDQEVLRKLEKLKGRGGWNQLFMQLLQEREDQLEKEKPEAVKTESRYIPAKIVNHVVKRTNGQCAFPQCLRAYDDIHHTERFSLTHVHDPDQLQILCKSHHTMAHHGLIDGEECGPENWRILFEADETAQKFHIDKIVQKLKKQT